MAFLEPWQTWHSSIRVESWTTVLQDREEQDNRNAVRCLSMWNQLRWIGRRTSSISSGLTCSRFFDNYIYDLNIHDIYMYIYIYILFTFIAPNCAKPKLFCFQALSQSPVRGSSFNTEASPGALRFCAQRIWSNEKIANACHFCTKCFGFNIWTCYVSTRLAVIGDDAATGHGAAGYNGWAAQMGKMLNKEFGSTLSFSHCLDTSLYLRVACAALLCVVTCVESVRIWFLQSCWNGLDTSGGVEASRICPSFNNHNQIVLQEAFKKGLESMLPKPAPEARLAG